MINRIVLAIIFLASLSWIVYVGLEISSDRNNYSPESLFNSADGEVLIVVRPSEVNFGSLESFIDAPCFDLMTTLNDSIYHNGYFSQKREHMLLVKDDKWTTSAIESLFGKANVSILSADEFRVGEYSGRFNKTKLYVWKSKILSETSGSTQSYKFDRKASAAIFRFTESGSVSDHSDIYFKPDGRINYITRDAKLKQGSQIRDEVLFSGITTRNFESYHFFERDYYASLDEVFANGPMSKWILNGFVRLTYQGKTVLISDYIGGQDPLLILNDLNQTQDSSVFNFQLLHDFPSENGTYTIKYLEDAVVISESAEAAENVIADYKLGNTIALDNSTRNKVFGQLPRSVSERKVDKNETYSKAVYAGMLMETHTGKVVKEATSTAIATSSITMSCGFDISDFVELPGNGNVVALGRNGEVMVFKDQKNRWKHELKSKPLGGIQLIDLYGTGENFVLINTKDEIHLWNLSGNYETGFPIKLENEASNEVKFVRWQEKGYFYIADENQKVIQFDSKGGELRMISTDMRITRQIDAWASQKKLFLGFANSSLFKMYDVEKKRIHREFPISTNSIPLKSPNQLFQYNIENNKLVKYDQKGTKFEFDSYNSGKLRAIQMDNSNPVLIVQSLNQILLINSEGVTFSTLKLGFNEIEDVHVFTDDSGKTFIGVIDGLENNVYLYGTNGEKVVNKSLEGQSKIRVSSSNNQKRITTIVDQFVIQYLEN